MTMILTVFELGMVAIAVWAVGTTCQGYMAATGNWWQRLLAGAKGSATILWSKFGMVVTALAALLATVPDYLGDPALANAIKANLKPEYVALFVIVNQIITIWARHRTL